MVHATGQASVIGVCADATAIDMMFRQRPIAIDRQESLLSRSGAACASGMRSSLQMACRKSIARIAISMNWQPTCKVRCCPARARWSQKYGDVNGKLSIEWVIIYALNPVRFSGELLILRKSCWRRFYASEWRGMSVYEMNENRSYLEVLDEAISRGTQATKLE